MKNLSGNGTAATLQELLRARYSLIYAVSAEEGRVESAIMGVAKSRKADLLSWGISRGFVRPDDSVASDCTDPIGALKEIGDTDEKIARVWVLRDFHAFLDDPTVRRWLRDLAVQLRQRAQQTIIILAPTLKLPADLEKDVAVLDWPLPSREQLGELLDTLLQQLPKGAEPYAQSREQTIEGAIGLTAVEAENVLARSLVARGKLDVGVILSAKRDIIRKSGTLEFNEAKSGLDSVGGLENLKPWLLRRRRAFTQEARDYGLDAPKGMLLLGPPGTGKSVTAGAVAAAWQLPLIRLDVGRLMGSLVGESEANWRQAIKLVESVAPCILFIDEIEKALAGAGSDSSGVTTRMMGSLLTWMSEQRAGVYVIATANDISGLPPELLRRGRFDEIWFIDLPNDAEREAIFKIHLAKRKRDASKFELAGLVAASRNFSGAEIEQAVIDALHTSFDENTELTTAHVLASVSETMPLAVTMEERIKALREWANGRARRASAEETRSAGNKLRILDLSNPDAEGN